MKIKLDENLPQRLVSILNRLGHDTDTVQHERLVGREDGVVWAAAQKAGRLLITQDLDFSDIRRFQPGSHHGLLLIRLHEPGRMTLLKRVQALFETEKVEAWQRCFVVVTDHKIRISSPPSE